MKRGLISIFAVVVLATGCMNTADVKPSQVSRAATTDFDVGDLPDPSRWSYKRFWYYFHPMRPTDMLDAGLVSYRRHTLSGRVEDTCGRVRPLPPRRSSNSAAIRFLARAIEETPKRAECWAKTGPELVERRAAELAYLQSFAPYLKTLKHPKSSSFDTDYYVRLRMNELTLENEMEQFERNIRAFATVNRGLARDIRQYKGWRAEERASWARAANAAVADFAQDNPFNQPSPGQGLATNTVMTNLARTMPNASPGLVTAMANLDQTMMGDDAYFRVVHRRAVALADAQRARSVAVGSVAPTITLDSCVQVELANSTATQCSYDTPEDRAQQAARDARIGQEKADAAAERARRDAQAAASVAASRRQAAAIRAAREAARTRCPEPGSCVVMH